jgi:Repeat of unknown function (DUF5648)
MKFKIKLISVAVSKVALITILLSSTISIISHAQSTALVPIFETYKSSYTDTFLTIDSQVRSLVINQYGYQDLGILGYVAKTTVPLGSLNNYVASFNRYFKGAPQVEHFYTSSVAEQNLLVQSYGYVAEGAEGSIFKNSAASGLMPVTRLAKYDGATGDLQHKWTLNSALVSGLVGQGWQNDGVAGYLFPPSFKATGTGYLYPNSVSSRPTFGVVTRAFCKLGAFCSPTSLNDWECPENVEIVINDSSTSTASSSYGVIGSGSSYGCRTFPSIQPAGIGSTKIRVEYSGLFGVTNSGSLVSIAPDSKTIFINY